MDKVLYSVSTKPVEFAMESVIDFGGIIPIDLTNLYRAQIDGMTMMTWAYSNHPMIF